jgi:hypothetical protein
MELYIIKFWMLYRKNANWIELQIHGDNVRFFRLGKTCDYIKYHNINRHARHYRYHFSYKNAKRGEPSKRFPLMITRKCNLAKFGYGGDMLWYLKLLRNTD